MTNRIENAYSGFTSDVITLLTANEVTADFVRLVDREELPDFLRDGLIASLAPFVQKLPAFAQQLLGRALVDHVDWATVAQVVSTRQDLN